MEGGNKGEGKEKDKGCQKRTRKEGTKEEGVQKDEGMGGGVKRTRKGERG